LAKLATLAFDEMDISRCYDYDSESDRVFGPNKKVQVAMIRGLCQSWKQPIFYDFDTKMTKALLFSIIINVEESGIQVWTVVFDLGNVGLLKTLGVSPEKPYFQNPFDPSRKIFVVPDPPHMLKLCRNHLLDEGFMIDENSYISGKDLEEIIRVDTKEYKICHKLTPNYFNVKGSGRQKVRLAAELLSHSTATAVKTLFHGKKKQADFIETINSWFDVMNSRLQYDKKKLSCAFGIHLDEQKEALEKMYNQTEKMRGLNKKSLLPFQRGILIGIRSIILLYEELSSR
jgi:hypothetical protein